MNEIKLALLGVRVLVKQVSILFILSYIYMPDLYLTYTFQYTPKLIWFIRHRRNKLKPWEMSNFYIIILICYFTIYNLGVSKCSYCYNLPIAVLVRFLTKVLLKSVMSYCFQRFYNVFFSASYLLCFSNLRCLKKQFFSLFFSVL